MRHAILSFIGIIAVIFGLVFMFQGLGVIRYPASSFMVDNSVWVMRGAIIAGLGALLVAAMRVIPVKRKRD
jgi:hypothetical protein